MRNTKTLSSKAFKNLDYTGRVSVIIYFTKQINTFESSEKSTSKNTRKLRNLQQAIHHYNTVDNGSKNSDKSLDGLNVHYSILDLDEVYKKPGKIINKNIVHFTKDRVYLKPNLQEIYDYVIVDYKAWHYLKEWYGYDYAIPANFRKVSIDL